MESTKDNFMSLFSLEEEPQNATENGVVEVEIEKLIPYYNHPFKIYTGKRLEDMVESIRENGVMMPIIVKPVDIEYMILSGHNRSNAARIAGLKTVPAIIKENISEGEAKLIVTQTNFFQRSVTDMLPSEKAFAFKLELEGLKEERKSSKKVEEIEGLENASNTHEQEVSAEVFQLEHLEFNSEKSREKLAESYGVSTTDIQRYIRLTYLIQELLDLVDEGVIAVRAGIPLTHCDREIQEKICELISENKYKVDIAKSEMIKAYYNANRLTDETLVKILNGSLTRKPKKEKPFSITLKANVLTPYFNSDRKEKEVVENIGEALKFREIEIPEIIKKYRPDYDQGQVKELTLTALDFYFKTLEESNEF